MKTWEKPKLIVLVRGKPEEAILTVCKTGDGTATSGPHWEFMGCRYDYFSGCVVSQCSAIGTS